MNSLTIPVHPDIRKDLEKLMTAQTRIRNQVTLISEDTNEEWDEPILNLRETFTRSNGTTLARIYERLTKASRRRSNTQSADYFGMGKMAEPAYRQGVYDAFKALQEELS